MTTGKKWNEYILEDFILNNYNPDPAIKAEMAV
jgi:thymidylate synthase